MKRIVFNTCGALLLCTYSAWAQPAEKTDLQLFGDVAKAVNRYERFTIFDDVSATVKNGVVTLTGKVTQPYKRDDLLKRVTRVQGVTAAIGKIDVLPVSLWDEQLRFRIARTIYGNANFWNYGAGANPSIHIIVERGRVTLTGVVNNDVDRMLARSLVMHHGVFSVTNNLRTEAEARAELETM